MNNVYLCFFCSLSHSFYHHCCVQQFRASLKRIFKHEIKPQSTAINETITNQISESSSRVYIECSFVNFKSRYKDGSKIARNINLINLKKKREIRVLIENQNRNNNDLMMSRNSECQISKTSVYL
jgi:hypothetical protein